MKKWLLAAALCIHWFNPLVWVMFFAACRDIELACDEDVVRGADGDIRGEYAMALIGAEEQKLCRASALCSRFGPNAAETRIRAVMTGKSTAARRVLAAFLASACLAGCLAVSARETGGLRVSAAGVFEEVGHCTGTVIFLRSVSFSGDGIRAVLGVSGGGAETPAFSGRVFDPVGNKTLFSLSGKLRALPAEHGVRYFALDAAAVPADLSGSDALSSCYGMPLTLDVDLGGSRFEFGTEVGSCDTGNFVIVSKLAASGGLAVGSLVLTSSELKISGRSSTLAEYYSDAASSGNTSPGFSRSFAYFPDLSICLLLSDGSRIDRHTRGGLSDMCVFFDGVGNFYVSWRFAGGSPAPDMGRVTGIVINGHTYALGG